MIEFDEATCLAFSGFEQWNPSVPALSDRIVRHARRECHCYICDGDIHVGERHREMIEDLDGEAEIHRHCEECCRAMTLVDRDPSILKEREEMGYEGREARGAE